MKKLTHLDSAGNARMVNVGAKGETKRFAAARANVIMPASLVAAVKDKKVPKGDVFAVAKCAGIMAAKKTSDLIPMCHQVALDSVNIEFEIEEDRIEIRAEARATGRTGVEMEALCAASAAALAIYDMCKALSKEMTISGITLLEKSGGRSGHYVKQ
ncbi:MAG: molybdenum cofactor biosynthesis protein C [Planctomycetes bacterium RBG_16_64_10]|nr:MAG: molybdenum cofactor biosynthesis protein C [Planctomycetes bacterium RBG_16_64_10]